MPIYQFKYDFSNIHPKDISIELNKYDTLEDETLKKLFWLSLRFPEKVPIDSLCNHKSNDPVVEQMLAICSGEQNVSITQLHDTKEKFEIFLFQIKHSVSTGAFDKAREQYCALQDLMQNQDANTRKLFYAHWIKDCLLFVRDPKGDTAFKLQCITDAHNSISKLESLDDSSLSIFIHVAKLRMKLYTVRLLPWEYGRKEIEKFIIMESDPIHLSADIALKCAWADLLSECHILSLKCEKSNKENYWVKAIEYYLDEDRTRSHYPQTIHYGIALCRIFKANSPEWKKGVEILQKSDWKKCYYDLQGTDLWTEFISFSVNILGMYYDQFCQQEDTLEKLPSILRKHIYDAYLASDALEINNSIEWK